MIEFIHNGFTYRTNGDASIVEGHDGKTWNRTHSLAARTAALSAITPKAKTPAQLDREIAESLTAPRDPFTGKTIEFGTILYLGKIRKDGKYPATFVYKSTGAKIGALLSPAQLEIEKARCEVRMKR